MPFHNFSAQIRAAKLEASSLINCSKPILPVDICYIAKLLGYSVDEAYIPWSGYLPEGQNVIIVRRTDSLERKRFTIAHEIGHILWGKISQENPMTSRTRHKNASPDEERIADQLAVELLMPEKEFQDEMSKRKRPSLADIVVIARLFAVSFESCLRRITELPEFVAFTYLYSMNVDKSGTYEISFREGYSSKPQLTFATPPLGIILNCIQHILRAHTAWEGHLRLRRGDQEFQIPSVGGVVIKNKQPSVRLIGWRNLNNPICYSINRNQLVSF